MASEESNINKTSPLHFDIHACLNLIKSSDEFCTVNPHDILPWIPVKDGWQIRAMPNILNGSISLARFHVRRKYWNTDDGYVSVYYDAWGRTGCFGKQANEPFWEVYLISRHSTDDNEPKRCARYDTDTLVKIIESALGVVDNARRDTVTGQ